MEKKKNKNTSKENSSKDNGKKARPIKTIKPLKKEATVNEKRNKKDNKKSKESKKNQDKKSEKRDLNKNNEWKEKVKKILILLGLFILLIIPLLSLTRIVNPAQLDDLHPSIDCPEIEKYNFNTIWVIPKFEGIPVSEDPEWCEMILSLNKTIGLHGYMHSYKEFEEKINASEIEEAIEIFEDCFGFKPSLFKPPQLVISEENQELLREYDITVRNNLNQITRKSYHCNDGGIFPNWFVQLI
ncbi:DUF2334 domain-containing protein [Patescibacteria group bacterium]|nr:DUF2334 domain-containing protein [Patescibacteria group bacterium]